MDGPCQDADLYFKFIVGACSVVLAPDSWSLRAFARSFCWAVLIFSISYSIPIFSSCAFLPFFVFVRNGSLASLFGMFVFVAWRFLERRLFLGDKASVKRDEGS